MKKLVAVFVLALIASVAFFYFSKRETADLPISQINSVGRFIQKNGETSYIYSTDGKSVFFNPDGRVGASLNQVKMTADLKTFEVVKEVGQAFAFSRDKSNVYVFDTVLPGIDPATFTPATDYDYLSEKNVYFRDKNHLYKLTNLDTGIPGSEMFEVVD